METEPGDAGSVTVTEFVFLALGLVLGVASGVALIEVLRARPPARREVRLTVSQDAIPRRRATTLADDAFVTSAPEPARGGPADRRELTGPAPLGEPDRRTSVLGDGLADPMRDAGRIAASGPPIGVAISGGTDPMLGSLQAAGRAVVADDAGRAVVADDVAAAAPSATRIPGLTAIGLLDPTPGRAGPTMPASAAIDAGGGLDVQPSGPCAAERGVAAERCALAAHAQAQAVAAADALRQAQRAYDAYTARGSAAAEAADPREIRRQKEAAQETFRLQSQAARSPGAIEEAARTWLHTINRINREAAAASLTADPAREAAAVIGTTLERLDRQANAARVGAKIAEAACMAARTAVAECDERAATGIAVSTATLPRPGVANPSAESGEDNLGAALAGGGEPRIFRLLRGDDAALEVMVASLAGDDVEGQARWRVGLAGLRDAIVADALDHAILGFPHEHRFWGLNTQQQNRDIVGALGSLGYRTDRGGGWLDDRRPTQRELSQALGYAGLDPMRVRHWPDEREMTELFSEVAVAADEYVAGAAGDLTLAEMVDLLGRRADGLVDLWNQWGRIRPLLLAEA